LNCVFYAIFGNFNIASYLTGPDTFHAPGTALSPVTPMKFDIHGFALDTDGLSGANVNCEFRDALATLAQP